MGNEHMCTYSRAGLSLFTRKPFKHGYSWTWNIKQKVNIHRLTMCPLSVLFSVLQEENLHVLFITSYGTHLYIPSHLFSLLWWIFIFNNLLSVSTNTSKRQFCFGFLSWFCITAMNRYLYHGHLGHTALMVSLKAPPTCCSNFCLQRVEEEGVNGKEQYILFQIG